MRRSLPARLALPAFAVGIAAVPLALAAIPPAQGTMLLWSWEGEDGARMAGWAAASGLRIVSRGPIDATIVVNGPIALAGPAAVAHGALVLAAPPRACGAIA